MNDKDVRKWTDGRYTLMFDEHTFFVFDNEREKRMTASRVTEKLNEQQEQLDLYKEAILTMLGLLAEKGIILSGVKDE